MSTAIPLFLLHDYMSCLGTKGFIMQPHNCHNLKPVPHAYIKERKCTNTRLFSIMERNGSWGRNTTWCKSIFDSGKFKWRSMMLMMMMLICVLWPARKRNWFIRASSLIFGELWWHGRYLVEMYLFLLELKMSRVVITLVAVILKDEQVNIGRLGTAACVLVPPLPPLPW